MTDAIAHTVVPAPLGYTFRNSDGSVFPVVAFAVNALTGRVMPVWVEPDCMTGGTVQFPAGSVPLESMSVSTDYQIKFGRKTSTKASFWKFSGSGRSFLITVEAGRPLPDDSRVASITRSAFYQFRRNMDVFTSDDFSPPGDDEDDGNNLI